MKELAHLITDFQKFHFGLTYSSITDWILCVYKSGCGDKGKDLEIFKESNCDLQYLISKAEVTMKDWLSEHNGGY